MLNKIVFLGILNSFLHPQNDPPKVESLNGSEITEMLSFAQMHSLYPVVYEALCKTEAFRSLPEQIQHACKQRAKRIVIGQTVRTDLFLNLYRQILSGGVTPLVVKGIVLRSLYAQPDDRASSDEDILVQKEEFYKLDEILVGLGFSRTLGPHPLEEHEITYNHPKTGIHLEIHLSLFPEGSGAYGHLNQAFGDVFERQVVEQIQGVEVHTLEPTQHMLYLICHGLKHFLHSGFGIRQVCDMVMFAESYGDQIDWPAIEAWARKQKFYLFWMNLMEIGEKYLGFSWEKAGLEKPKNVTLDCEAMLEDLLDGGIYGQSSASRLHSANMTLQAAAGGRHKVGIIAAMFPGLSYMKRKFPYLELHPWLLPLAWGQRALRYLKKTDKREISVTMDTGKRRVELLKQYGLAEKNS